MAILEKIRKKSTLLILIIGLSLFAFVVSDIIRNRGGFGSIPQDIGSVNGNKIPISEFRQSVENASRGVNAPNLISTVNYVWDFEIKKELTKQSASELGMVIDRSLLEDVVNSNDTYKQYYSSVMKDGVFNVTEYYSTINNIKNTNPNVYQQWMMQEDYVINQEISNAYNMLVKAGLNRTLKEAEVDYKLKEDKVSFSYVRIPYTKIADSLVFVLDAEISNYLKAHPEEYQQEDSVDFKYVFFEEKPSVSDEDNIKKDLTKLLSPTAEYNNETQKVDSIKGFAFVKDYASFINKYSDKPYSDKYLFEKQLPAVASSDIIALKKNETFGPYKDQDHYKLTRKIGTTKLSDSVKSSHIIVPFIGSQGSDKDSKTKEEAKKYIDSIYSLVKTNKSKFSQVADSINTDGTKGKGGDIGWVIYSKIDDYSFDKDFSKYIFFNKVNSIEVVESAFGYHIIRIDEKGSQKEAYQLATIARRIEPSEETINTIFSDVGNFEIAVSQKKESFETASKDKAYNVRTASKLGNNKNIMTLVDSPREIIRWGLTEENSIGAIRRFNKNNGYVIAQITARHKKGLMALSEARPLIEPILKKQKKAQKIKEQYEGKSFDEMASDTELGGALTAEGISAKRPTIPSGGSEPKVVGVAFSLDKDATSSLIEGSQGVFIIKVANKEEANPKSDYKDYATKMDNNNDYFLNQNVSNALKKMVEIEDNRLIFY